ncbi:MAG: hypothetical protein MHPSP_004034, partial [Paramarteilia canceri]
KHNNQIDNEENDIENFCKEIKCLVNSVDMNILDDMNLSEENDNIDEAKKLKFAEYMNLSEIIETEEESRLNKNENTSKNLNKGFNLNNHPTRKYESFNGQMKITTIAKHNARSKYDTEKRSIKPIHASEDDDPSENSDYYNRKHGLGKWKNNFNSYKSLKNYKKNLEQIEDEVQEDNTTKYQQKSDANKSSARSYKPVINRKEIIETEVFQSAKDKLVSL